MRKLIFATLAAWVSAFPAADAAVFPFAPSSDLFVDYDAGFAKVDGNFLDVGDGQGGVGQDDRALLKFDFSPIAGAAVSSATLNLNQVELGNPDRYGKAQLRRIGTMDWDGTESGNTLYDLARDANSVQLGDFSPATNPPPGPKTVDVTGTVQGWVDGSMANYGFGLMQASEGFSSTQRRFLSGNVGGVSVSVDFTPTPGGSSVADLAPTVDLFIDASAGFAKIDGGQLDVGHGGTGTRVDDRALLKFDVSSLAGSTVQLATLTLGQQDTGNADRYGTGQLRRIGTMDWDGTETGAALYDLARDANSVIITNFSPAQDPPPGPYFLDVTTLVQGWIDGSVPNYGLSLLQSSEGFDNTQRRFTSSDAGSGGPVLSVLFSQPTAIVPEPAGLPVWPLLVALGIGVRRRR